MSNKNIDKRLDVFYKEKIDDFCRNHIDQFNKVESRFAIDERELITIKLNEIWPEIERLERAFYEKTKNVLHKVTKYSPD